MTGLSGFQVLPREHICSSISGVCNLSNDQVVLLLVLLVVLLLVVLRVVLLVVLLLVLLLVFLLLLLVLLVSLLPLLLVFLLLSHLWLKTFTDSQRDSHSNSQGYLGKMVITNLRVFWFALHTLRHNVSLPYMQIVSGVAVDVIEIGDVNNGIFGLRFDVFDTVVGWAVVSMFFRRLVLYVLPMPLPPLSPPPPSPTPTIHRTSSPSSTPSLEQL